MGPWLLAATPFQWKWKAKLMLPPGAAQLQKYIDAAYVLAVDMQAFLEKRHADCGDAHDPGDRHRSETVR